MSKKALFERSSAAFSGNASYLEHLYEQYAETPETLTHGWSKYFDEVCDGHTAGPSHARIQQDVIANVQRPALRFQASATSGGAMAQQLVQHYEHHGHLHANIDPLGLQATRAKVPSWLQLKTQGQDPIGSNLYGLSADATLDALKTKLEATYAGSIGIEYMHLQDVGMRSWLQQRMASYTTWQPHKDTVRQAMYKLQCAEHMELLLGRKFIGQTRFSLEGGEALIPMMEQLLAESVGRFGVKETVIGMPHRGRLNVMLNILGMRFDDICDIYTGKREDVNTSSDVTYHMGYSADRVFSGQTAHISLAFNPSHLEFIAPVVMGSVKCRQQRHFSECPEAVMPIILHGDSAVCGQGVVAEWFNMMHAPAHQIQGAIHIVVNNQIGFTTYREASRSGIYCTDAHRYADVPVLHVNGNDTDAVLFCAELAAAYRAKFKRSIIIDLNCYRKYGHNEGDDPRFTQPMMYRAIDAQSSPRALYQDKCSTVYGYDPVMLQQDEATIKTKLKAGDRLVALAKQQTMLKDREALWQDHTPAFDDVMPNTALSQDTVRACVEQLTTLPQDFVLHRQVEKLFEEYQQAANDAHPVRWGLAEQLAYASLLREGFGVRLVGQDVERGTFSHRHAMLHDQKTGAQHCPLANISNMPHGFQIHNSVLSEQAVLAFEYGFASTHPGTLTIWEAQYGDFANGAQIIIDQFIASAWQKWARMSGLVMLLPHGYEGAGPEHSSARLERFLQLSAQHNMRVCMPSSAAQMFHLLRLQMHQKARIPLIVMSPKKSLRLPDAMSPLSDICEGGFQTVLPEQTLRPSKQIKRAILCSGKVYFDLVAHREAQKIKNVAIVRVEQLYPFDETTCREILGEYSGLKTVVWCQEEPRNQGAWYTIRHHLETSMPSSVVLTCVSRIRAASPAAGYQDLHKKRQQRLIAEAFTDHEGA